MKNTSHIRLGLLCVELSFGFQARESSTPITPHWIYPCGIYIHRHTSHNTVSGMAPTAIDAIASQQSDFPPSSFVISDPYRQMAVNCEMLAGHLVVTITMHILGQLRHESQIHHCFVWQVSE